APPEEGAPANPNAPTEPYTGVRQRAVKLGATRGDLVEIVEGLQPGQEVVSSGTFKIKDKAPVNVNNDIQPGADPDPKVTES
ncbi:MAG: hypothetical protein WA771_06495, partial [Chthoniobacterales bacterium]